MNIKLFFQAMLKIILGVLSISLLLFIPAGSLNYWNAWLLIGLLFIPMFLSFIVMAIKSPSLLKKRLNMKEAEKEQQQVILFSTLMFISGFIISGLNYKYNWTSLPTSLIVLTCAIFTLAYIMYAEVLRENKYLSRNIEIQENQKVVETGLYGIIRHPMYASTILLFLSIPIILGSLPSFIIFLSYPFIINKRIKNEEELLENNLPGYSEYKKKVKYKILPFIW